MTTDPVGSLADEAAKLLAVVQSWAQPGSRPSGNPDRSTDRSDDESLDGERAGVLHEAAPGEGGGHTHSTSECRFCPLCKTMRLARAATPEVRAHVGSAVLSLSMAVSELLDNVRSDAPGPPSAEDVDLAED